MSVSFSWVGIRYSLLGLSGLLFRLVRALLAAILQISGEPEPQRPNASAASLKFIQVLQVHSQNKQIGLIGIRVVLHGIAEAPSTELS